MRNVVSVYPQHTETVAATASVGVAAVEERVGAARLSGQIFVWYRLRWMRIAWFAGVGSRRGAAAVWNCMRDVSPVHVLLDDISHGGHRFTRFSGYIHTEGPWQYGIAHGTYHPDWKMLWYRLRRMRTARFAGVCSRFMVRLQIFATVFFLSSGFIFFSQRSY